MTGPVILHIEVFRAMESLRSCGKKPTVDAVRAVLSGRGSPILVLRLMAEVIAAEAAVGECEGEFPATKAELKLVANDSAQTGKAPNLPNLPNLPKLPDARNLALAEQLQATLDPLVEEAEALLGCSKGVFEKIERLEVERSRLTAELKECRAQLAIFRGPTLSRAEPLQGGDKGGADRDMRVTLGL